MLEDYKSALRAGPVSYTHLDVYKRQGWKGMRAAERLVEQYMVRIESVSSYSANAAAN